MSTLRSDGRSVLESLNDLRAVLLGSSDFEGAPGLTIFMVLTPESVGGDRDNVLLDVGARRGDARLMIVIDADDHLVARLFDGHGSRVVVRSPADVAYGTAVLLEVCVGLRDGKMLIRVDTGSWCGERIVDKSSDAFGIDPRAFVIGSDVTGAQDSRFALASSIMYSVVSSREDIEQRRAFSASELELATTEAYFGGGQFLYTVGHPTHASAADAPAGVGLALIQSNPARRPRRRAKRYPPSR